MGNAIVRVTGCLPEVHAWAMAKDEDGVWLIDLSIKYVSLFFKESFRLAGVDWTWEPPEYLQVRHGDRWMRNGEPPRYTPDHGATAYVRGVYDGAAREGGYPAV